MNFNIDKHFGGVSSSVLLVSAYDRLFYFSFENFRAFLYKMAAGVSSSGRMVTAIISNYCRDRRTADVLLVVCYDDDPVTLCWLRRDVTRVAP